MLCWGVVRLNKLERVSAKVAQWKAEGQVVATVLVSDFVPLATLAKAVAEARAAQHRLYDLPFDVGLSTYDAAMDERSEAIVDVFTALDPLLLEETGHEG